jgi:hypothetical protein
LNAAPPPKKIIGQMALCDDTVPNPFNLNLYGLIGLGQVDATHSTRTTFFTGATATPSCPNNAAGHSFLLDWKNYATLASAGQADITSFFADTSVLPPPSHNQ